MVWQPSIDPYDPAAESPTHLQSIRRSTSGGGEISENASRSSRGSKWSESTEKRTNGPSPRSTLMPPQLSSRDRVRSGSGNSSSNRNAAAAAAAKNSSPAQPRNLFGRKVENKEDAKIAAYIVKLKDELKRLQELNGGDTPTKQKSSTMDVTRLTEILTKIRMLLDVRVEKGNKSAMSPDIQLGPNIVEVMRHYPSNHSLLMEECTCILYFVSVLDPTFKKGVARLFKAMSDHKSNVAIQRAACEGIRNVSTGLVVQYSSLLYFLLECTTLCGKCSHDVDRPTDRSIH